ncbi:UNVERIFIED_CONTAM: hypothetical protein Slati_4502100 [Sesamum latifolium]|uniref:Uncharacterized protein n=1 Tax=Sesamum latifolium TaxID=2727402 RepID=A0AAW2STE1_9LAMI
MQWDRECFGNIRWKTKELNDKICRMQEGVITPMVKAEVEYLKDSMDKLAASAEILWEQRSKALWLAAEDRNTSFFHAKANERRLNKEIKCIKNEAEVEVTDKEGIQNVVLSYFCDIFRSIHPMVDAMEEVLRNMDRRVTDVMNDAIDLPFMLEEVLNALKQMHPLKSPGPDVSVMCSIVRKHDKYLGLPMVADHSKNDLFEGIKDRIWRKLHNWVAKKLSQARAILLKIVLQTIPIYAMSCFRIPDTFLNELESVMVAFFWSCDLESKIH